ARGADGRRRAAAGLHDVALAVAAQLGSAGFTATVSGNAVTFNRSDGSTFTPSFSIDKAPTATTTAGAGAITGTRAGLINWTQATVELSGTATVNEFWNLTVDGTMYSVKVVSSGANGSTLADAVPSKIAQALAKQLTNAG